MAGAAAALCTLQASEVEPLDIGRNQFVPLDSWTTCMQWYVSRFRAPDLERPLLSEVIQIRGDRSIMNSDGGHHNSDGGSYTMQHEDLFTFT